MFQSTNLTKHSRLFTHSLTSFTCFTHSLVVKGLSMWDFGCETCFCQIFWQLGTEFLCLANLTFRFVFMRLIRSLASAICSAYKWIHPHLVEFQCTEKNSLHCQKLSAWAINRDPLMGSNFTELCFNLCKNRSAYSRINTVAFVPIKVHDCNSLTELPVKYKQESTWQIRPVKLEVQRSTMVNIMFKSLVFISMKSVKKNN